MMEKYIAKVSKNENTKVRYQSHIPNDIAFSILLKLSIKSLKRFGCVCKSWSLLFENPNFINIYRKIFLEKDHSYYNDKSILLHKTISSAFDGYYFEEKFELYSVSDERFENIVQLNWPKVTLDRRNPLLDYDSGYDILGPGSVNGTLCLNCAYRMNIVLWNPSTDEFIVIPPSPFDSEFQNAWVNHTGFGYDSVADDFKVLRHSEVFQKINSDNDMLPGEDIYFISVWEIYSVRSNSWKKLDVDMYHVQSKCVQLYIDGVSHWLCTTKPNNKVYLLSFDWSNEVFLETPLPSDMEDIVSFSVQSCLVLLNGSIALTIIYKETDMFHILILGELGVRESWTKIFVGSLPCFEWTVGAGKKGRLLFQKKDRYLAWLDLNTQMIEDLDLSTEKFYFDILFHKENLLPFERKSI